ncbi:D-alanine--D-alanine ligase family protein [Xanthocytophaga flava]|uniref:D-alanine--D-alanine ligase family protein n=1 Tax=Xanthocytophaga flava TaxID=3048013 RepID=UPI0028D3A7AB|nr:D-alanine--D-alanine ligase [Xanthocytophaga flavus]MDJ1471984.1 D-alanine--D-alanine ligase [Xanthocytophaga flavus]
MLKVGIIFGGPSREREISFAGGRTVYDNLNKSLFEPVPIFVDSLGNFILLNWEFIYKGTIRDFYPPVSALPASAHGFQIYLESLGKLSEEEQDRIILQVGKKVEPKDFADLFEFAFLTLHGPAGEDGSIQGLLEWYGIPYSGSGILSSAIGVSKTTQKELMRAAGFATPKTTTISRDQWFATDYKGDLISKVIHQIGLPFVVKAPNQGSSIGVSVVTENDMQHIVGAINRSFFIQEITGGEWQKYTEEQKVRFITSLTDIREGIGLPCLPLSEDGQSSLSDIIYHPEELYLYLEKVAQQGGKAILANLNGEEEVLIEGFLPGKEFSCIVIQGEDGQPIALPPTQIIKGGNVFDYRSKYLPGMSRKVTPIDVPDNHLEVIRKECCRLFKALHFNVYARIDGFINSLGEVFLNDPNTTSGMLPSSFFFHQAAEIGMNPSQFLTYIIRTSLVERTKAGKNSTFLKSKLKSLDNAISALHSSEVQKTRVGVIMGGFSSERHISVESGRNIYEKLASSGKYDPLPVFLTGTEQQHELYVMPINIMLKDNADDIKEKILSGGKKHPIIQQIGQEAKSITEKYVGKAIDYPYAISYHELADAVDEVFIALHGRPGEDGAVQSELEKVGLSYNGSGVESSQTTINKYETNKILRSHGISVANHDVVYQTEWEKDPEGVVKRLESQFSYPIIAKPADDGCSSAVKKIDSREELIAFAQMMFRPTLAFLQGPSQILELKASEEFPQKSWFLVEELISRKGAKHFLEITGGLLTKLNQAGELEYEVFEPSEALASGEILSLEEKFLAGEGQNITPARFSKDQEAQKYISQQVRATLQKTAEILHVEGYARIDAFVRIFDDNRAETIIIEVNSLPGMTPATCIFHQTAINGYKPYQFIDAILEYGRQRNSVTQ